MTISFGKKAGGAAALEERASAQRSFARFRLILTLLSGLIIGAVVYGAWSEIQSDRETTVTEALKRARILTDSLADHASATFRMADIATATLVELREDEFRMAEAARGRMAEFIRSMINASSPYRNLVITNAAGEVVYDNTGIPPGFNVADREFFSVHRADPQAGVFISEPVRSRLGRGWFIAVSRRIDLPGGGFGGVAYALIDLSYFERHYREAEIGDFGFATLWAQGGKVLARVPRDQKLIEDPGAYAERISRLRGQDLVEETYSRSPIDGLNRWIIARAVDDAPLRVSVGIAEREVLARWERATPWQAASALSVVGLVTVLTSILLVYLSRLERTAEALRESERRSRALFESTFEYISMLSPDGRVLAVNRAAMDLAADDRADDQPTGQELWRLAPWRRSPEAQRQIRDGVRRAAAGEFVRFESDLSTNKGARTVDISIKPICDERGVAETLIAEARDVTDRKRSEDSLRASEARVRSYFDAAMEGIFVTDRAGRFIDGNPAACRMLGYGRDELMTMTIADLLAHDGGVAAAAHLATVFADGAFRGELRLRRRGGSVGIAEVSAVRLESDFYLGVFRDVTQRRREAEALRASNARIAALLRAIPDLVLLMDGDGLYLEVVTPPNDSRLAIAAERLLGRRPADVLPAAVAEQIMAAVAAAATAEQHVVTVEFQLDLADGLRWFEARFTAMADTEALVLQITRDVTERVEAAARLADAKEQAEAANRTKSAFLATMSHELRTPLNAIIGFSDIMRSQMFGPVENPRYCGYLDNIHDSGAHLLALINDVLDISKLEAGKYALEEGSIIVSELVDNCCALSETAAAAGGLQFEWTVAADLPIMTGDERAIRQVLLNLLSNAIKFTPDGGRVNLTATMADDGELAIIVADTGIGIPAEALARIAQPFQQVDNSIARRFGGTGLGLAISRNLMELHGGRLAIDSREGHGTTVTARFPAHRLGRPLLLSLDGAPPSYG